MLNVEANARDSFEPRQAHERSVSTELGRCVDLSHPAETTNRCAQTHQTHKDAIAPVVVSFARNAALRTFDPRRSPSLLSEGRQTPESPYT